VDYRIPLLIRPFNQLNMVAIRSDSPPRRDIGSFTSRASPKQGFFIWCLCLTAPVLYFHSKMIDRVSDAAIAHDYKGGAQGLRQVDRMLSVVDTGVQPGEKINVPANEPNVPAKGQHLLIDLSGSTFDVLNDEEYMKQATLNIVKATGMTLLGISSFKLEPQGVSVVATLAESHLTIHTWPEHGQGLVDLFTCGAGFNLQEALPIVIKEYQGDLDQSTFSVVPRGDFITADNVKDKIVSQFQPLEIMGTHKYKQKVFEIQSPYQHIAIWDHHDTSDDSYTKETTRSLYLDGVIQSNVDDEEKYHQTLVHPAMLASATPPKRVLIVGGGEGGTLRESLKWSSVETVTMVDLDAEVINASREYLPSYNNCTGFGSAVCFDDPRVELYTEDFIAWFDKHIGNDICDTREQKKDKLYDVVILDLLDTEELPEGQPWAEHLYSKLFFNRIACAVNEFGVVVSNFGEAPGNPYGTTEPEDMSEADQSRLQMFTKKIKQIQTMSSFFRHTRVFEASIPAYRSDWAFAIGIVPNISKDIKAIGDIGNEGINDFEGAVARVNLKLRRNLHANAQPLSYYDGAIQHTYQYPTAGWHGVYCMNPENKLICDIPKTLFSTDREEEFFEPKLNINADGKSGVYAKKDMKKGHVSGLYDAATAIQLPASDYQKLKSFVGGQSDNYKSFFKFLEIYQHEGGGTSNTVHNSMLSLHTFANHACDHNPNFKGIYEELPWSQELFVLWNPVGTRIRTELEHVVIATRDVKEGEMLTADYTEWDRYSFSTTERTEKFKEWCGKDYTPVENDDPESR